MKRRWIAPAALIVAMLVAWELLAKLGHVENYLLPAPTEVVKALIDDSSLLLPDAWVTIKEVLLGFAIALLAGIGIAVALHSSPVLRRATYPLVVASQAVPIVVIAPILVIWFGYGIGPKLAVIALICFFPIVVGTLDGLQSVGHPQRAMMRTLGASRREMLLRLELPAALPSIFSGTKIAIAVAVIGAVFGELVGSEAGLGHAIQIGTSQLETARVFAAVTLLAAMAIALFCVVVAVERATIPWSGKEESRA